MTAPRHSQILRIIPVLSTVCLLCFPAQAQYSGGTGEPNDPYQIATAADLIALGETPEDYDKHFILTADIDLDPNLPGGKVFDKGVIGWTVWLSENVEQVHLFNGVFDGNGHTISHLTIIGDSGYVGLFGYLGPQAVVKDLGVMDVNIGSSGSSVGGLVGRNSGSVDNCYSTGTVTVSGGLVGGLVGRNVGSISISYSSTDVHGNGWIGGLVGENGDTVTQCYSTGVVNGDSDVGGLVGLNSGRSQSSNITACYSTSSVTGNKCVGGLVGRNGNGNITVSYSVGTVNGSENVGGLLGHREYGNVLHSMWDTEASALSISDGGVGLTTVEMLMQSTFTDAGWDFVGETANGTEDIWKIVEGQTYPLLSWQKYSGGTGEPNDPYQIATAADLIALGEDPNDYDKHFILTDDIDLDPNLPGGRVFDKAVIAPGKVLVVPTSRSSGYTVYDGTAFTGVFDGNGHTISHLAINGGDYLGLFGGAIGSDAQIKNLGVVAVNIVGAGDYIGGLAGEGSATNCHVSGSVSGRTHVGGLIGSGSVNHCRSTAIVSGDWDVGGLLGSGSATHCYSTGEVNGRSNVGGLVGRNGWIISQCYSTGSVHGDENVGGLAGCNNRISGQDESSPAEIVNCYSTGNVDGRNYVGGLVGDNNPGSVTGCYSAGEVSCSLNVSNVGGLVGGGRWGVKSSFWNTQTSGEAESDGGTGKTTAEMQTAATFLDAGWDFVGETVNGTEDVWKIAEGLDYPRLWWEPYDGRVTVVLGQVFAVTLESNPSTGYRWEWVDHQDSIVEQMGEAQFTPRETGDPPLVGAGGWESFDFKVVHPGQMTLKLVYRRPWEEGVEPLKTFSLQVTVP